MWQALIFFLYYLTVEKNFSFREIRFVFVTGHTISVGCVKSYNSHNQYHCGILSPATTAFHSVFLAHTMPKTARNQAPDGRIIPQIAVALN